MSEKPDAVKVEDHEEDHEEDHKETHVSRPIEIDEASGRRLLRKIDWKLMPVVSLRSIPLLTETMADTW